MKTYTPKASDLRPEWQVLDASGQTLGRLAVQVAHLLKGKHKPTYAPHMLTGDFVIVINSRRVKVTGNKSRQKTYYRHSQYPGGLREVSLSEMLTRHPNRVIEHAVKGMLPHNRLGRQMLRRLKVYSDAEHPHQAQVTASIKAFEKMESEGPVWVGLPKPTVRRRPRKKKVVETAPEPVAETAPGAPKPDAKPAREADAAVVEPVPETAASVGSAPRAEPEPSVDDVEETVAAGADATEDAAAKVMETAAKTEVIATEDPTEAAEKEAELEVETAAAEASDKAEEHLDETDQALSDDAEATTEPMSEEAAKSAQATIEEAAPQAEEPSEEAEAGAEPTEQDLGKKE